MYGAPLVKEVTMILRTVPFGRGQIHLWKEILAKNARPFRTCLYMYTLPNPALNSGQTSKTRHTCTTTMQFPYMYMYTSLHPACGNIAEISGIRTDILVIT